MLDPAILNEGANAIRRDAQRVRALLALADELEKISKIENTASEAQARLDTLLAEETRVRAELGELVPQLETARDEFARMTKLHEEFLEKVRGNLDAAQVHLETARK